jgi:hypothetical protein
MVFVLVVNEHSANGCDSAKQHQMKKKPRPSRDGVMLLTDWDPTMVLCVTLDTYTLKEGPPVSQGLPNGDLGMEWKKLSGDCSFRVEARRACQMNR